MMMRNLRKVQFPRKFSGHVGGAAGLKEKSFFQTWFSDPGVNNIIKLLINYKLLIFA
jgi:hypothetical protein